MSPVELESVLTCPLCGVSTRETMPTNACRWFHECAACHAIFQPLPGTAACTARTARSNARQCSRACPAAPAAADKAFGPRSEEHTSELQSLMRISYAVLCLKKKTTT